jgi:hypothetical protein
MTTRRASRWVLVGLFSASVFTSLAVLWVHIVPLFAQSAWTSHVDHQRELTIHIGGGVAMLAFGAAALFIGWTRRGFAWHRWIGYGYLSLGTMGAAAALDLSIAAPHAPKSLYVATGTLAVVWIAVAAMALRSAVNRRYDTHREWMIRSYVLSWTFVGCRLAEGFSFFPGLGNEGVTASIWINWIAPLVLCEISLQWRKTGPLATPARRPMLGTKN